MSEAQGLIDLHTHTTASDGTFTAKELVREAKRAGLAAVAVTDHDSAASVEEALSEGKMVGIRVVSGVELSTALSGKEIHIVGLFTDPNAPALRQQLKERGEERKRRNKALLDKLEELNMPVRAALASMEPKMLTRTHVAEAMVKCGYAKSTVQALESFLVPGQPAWIEKRTPTVEECISVIHSAGGVAVLAHIDRIDKNNAANSLAIARMALDKGFDGIEAAYATYTAKWRDTVLELAGSYRLLKSGGSDFHGEKKPNRLGIGLGEMRVPYEWLLALESAAQGYK